MNSLSSHVLDTTLGKPAVGMNITLTAANGETFTAITNDDGRCSAWGDIAFSAGTYNLRFECKAYLEKHHGKSFYPYVDIAFEISSDAEHYHVPLLVTPFGYSTYRGS